jgi:hypothetical protein
VIVAVFRDCEGIILLDVLQTGTTINSETYINFLKKMKKLFHRVRPEKNLGEILLQHDQAR